MSPKAAAPAPEKNGHRQRRPGTFQPGNNARGQAAARQRQEAHQNVERTGYGPGTSKAVVHEAGVAFKKARGFDVLSKILSGTALRKVVYKHKDKHGTTHIEQGEEGPTYSDVIAAGRVLLEYWKGKPPQIVQHTGAGGGPVAHAVFFLPHNGRK